MISGRIYVFRHCFQVSVADLQDQKRGKAYVYTPELRRLYSVSVEPVAFEVKVSSEVPPNCAMYVFAIYSDQRYRSENVVTCAYHRQTKDSDEQASGECFCSRVPSIFE